MTTKISQQIFDTMVYGSALDWIDDLIKTTEQGAAELRRQRERFIESMKKSDTLATPVNVLSWTVNAVQNIQRNYRMDLAVNHAAALSAVANQKGKQS